MEKDKNVNLDMVGETEKGLPGVLTGKLGTEFMNMVPYMVTNS